MKKMMITLWLALSLQGSHSQGEPLERAGRATTSCRPTYVLLESSSRLRSVKAVAATLAVVGCQSDLDRLSGHQLAAAERELLRLADEEDWWQKDYLSDQSKAEARLRLSKLVRADHPLAVFFARAPSRPWQKSFRGEKSAQIGR
jgi:hypothetical protein